MMNVCCAPDCPAQGGPRLGVVDLVDLVECDREIIADMRPVEVELPTTKHRTIPGAMLPPARCA